MNLLSWIIFGMLNGIVANALDPYVRSQLTVSILLGIIGAMIGGILAFLFFGRPDGFSLTVFLMAMAGSFLALFALRMVRK
jgi:uncharacterized membrane protein YeaQ/YmgE (transglycosylase-associated protein family)